MKIFIINASDIRGGAARASYRLHRALLAEGVDSLMLVQSKFSDDYTVLGPETKLEKAIALIRPTIDQIPVTFYKKRSKTLFSPSWLPFSNVVKKINEIKPDIVHLHWIGGGMMRIEDIASIKAPIVWTLHDMWVFTGGCHYDENCGRYQEDCGKCKVLGSMKSSDLSRKVFLKKQNGYIQKNFTIICLSKWLGNCAKNSTLLKDKKIYILPNPIDTEIYQPFDKGISRTLWRLPEEKKLVLFGAIGATSDPRKGFKELNEALRFVKSNNIELVIFGSSQPKNSPNLGFKTHYLGHLSDDISLVTLYNAVDLTIVPSLQENLSNTIMESMACGTPVVAFDIGGNSDMIDHLENGYLAKPFDTEDLANGIEWVLNSSEYTEFIKNARRKVLENFDSKIVAKKYIELYREILNER